MCPETLHFLGWWSLYTALCLFLLLRSGISYFLTTGYSTWELPEFLFVLGKVGGDPVPSVHSRQSSKSLVQDCHFTLMDGVSVPWMSPAQIPSRPLNLLLPLWGIFYPRDTASLVLWLTQVSPHILPPLKGRPECDRSDSPPPPPTTHSHSQYSV